MNPSCRCRSIAVAQTHYITIRYYFYRRPGHRVSREKHATVKIRDGFDATPLLRMVMRLQKALFTQSVPEAHHIITQNSKTACRHQEYTSQFRNLKLALNFVLPYVSHHIGNTFKNLTPFFYLKRSSHDYSTRRSDGSYRFNKDP